MTNAVIQNGNKFFIIMTQVPILFRDITCMDILYNFRVGCTPFLQRFFVDSNGSPSLFLLSYRIQTRSTNIQNTHQSPTKLPP